MAHDIYTTLNMMEHNIDYLVHRVEKEDISIQDIESLLLSLGTSTKKIKHLLDILFTLDAINKSQLNVYDRKPIDLIRRLKDKLKYQCFESKGVVWIIGCNVPHSSNIINVEKFYITALNCILDNATKYACPGSIICVTVYSDKLEISNVGIPIPEDEMNRIFDNGFRGKEVVNNVMGSGSDLYIAKKVFDAYNSTISITSESIVERNEEVKSATKELIDSLNKEKSLEHLSECQYNAARKTIESICKIYNMNFNSKCHFINENSVKDWLNYWVNSLYSDKNDIIESTSYEPNTKVTVTIIYGKEKDNTRNRR